MAGFQNDPGTRQQEAGFGFLDGFWAQSNQQGLTAKASGTQSTTPAVQAMVNQFTTVATTGDGAKLPAGQSALVGVEILLINLGANSMQVFGSGSDTINGVAGSVGVSQVANSAVYYVCTAYNPVTNVANWVANGIGTGFNGQIPTFASIDGLTAAGTNQGNAAVAQNFSVVRYTTVAAGTGALLPAAKVGTEITICNAGANAILIYAAVGTDVINALANATGFSIAAGKSATFYATSNGQWHTLLSA